MMFADIINIDTRYCYSRIYASFKNFISQQCDHRCSNKKLPNYIQKLPEKNPRILLKKCQFSK